MAELEYVDTHTHLNDAKFLSGGTVEIEAALARAAQAHVTRLINMGDTLESSEQAVDLAEKYADNGVYAGVGIHPEEARPMTSEDDDILAGWTDMPHVVCIGEIGLDYHWEKDMGRRALQQEVFIRQLDLARQLHMPVCIHSRDAHADTLRILREEGRGLTGVLHCYSGSVEMARELVELGWFIGVDGPVTFKNAKRNIAVVREVPLERLLLETDAPYMAPEPVRGTRNEPANIPYIAQKVAEIKDISVAKVAAATTASARELYGLD